MRNKNSSLPGRDSNEQNDQKLVYQMEIEQLWRLQEFISSIELINISICLLHFEIPRLVYYSHEANFTLLCYNSEEGRSFIIRQKERFLETSGPRTKNFQLYLWDREDIALDFEFVEDKFVKWTLNAEPVWEEFYTHKEVTSVLNREYVKESTNSNQNLLSKLPITLEQVKYLHNQLFTFVCKRRPKNTEAAPSDDILSKIEAVYSDFPSEFIVRRTQLKSAANV